MIKIYLLLFALFLMSCGKAVNEDGNDESREVESSEGSYSAFLIPVNSRISNHVHGEVKVSRYGDQFQVDVQLKGAPRGRITQYLHSGSWCPKINQDVNGDGYLDSYETILQAGYQVVPFDGDLSAQYAGSNFVLQGNYTYKKSTSYYLMLSDLHLPDEIVNDSMIKLNDNDLSLERKAVVIYAVQNNVPYSVSGREVPIACGVLTKTSDYPPTGDTWDDYEPPPRPRPYPRPRPEPQPDPEPPPEPQDNHDSWWDRLRDRWNRWRNGGGSGEHP